MQSNVTVSDKLSKMLTEYSKEQIFWYMTVIGSVAGMLLQGFLGLKGMLILAGVYMIVRYYNKGKS